MTKPEPAPENEIYRTRLFLITPEDYEIKTFAKHLDSVLGAGDVASLLITPTKTGDYQQVAETLAPIAQAHDVAALLHNDSRTMGRSNADGLHLDGSLEDIVETVKAHAGREIMGVSNLKNRDQAMQMGEGPVDYLFFGRLDGDTEPDIFPKTFKLAEWWSSLFEVPAVVMGGNSIESAKQAADAGIDFIALRNAIWQSEAPDIAIREANRLLDVAFNNRKALINA